MRTQITILLTLAVVGILAFTLGTAGCPTKPDDPPVTPTTDYDELVKDIAEAATFGGTLLMTNPKDFATCIAGVSLKATGDATLAVAIPVKQSVEAGECKGTTQGFTIDPSSCVGLPGTPDSPESVELAKADVQAILDLVLPMASFGVDKGVDKAKADGEEGWCTALSLLRDLLSPAGELAGSILVIVEKPGEPFAFPGATWDCSACKGEDGEAPGDDDDSAATSLAETPVDAVPDPSLIP